MYNPEDLKELCSTMFKNHSHYFPLWNSIAKYLAPEYANFNGSYFNGANYASALSTSAPVTKFRDLTDNVGTILRYGQWFDIKAKGIDESDASREWLQRATLTQMEYINNKDSGFSKSSKIHDKQYMLFGNSPKSITLNRDRTGLLFRTHGLKDVAWMDDYSGNVEVVARIWEPTYRQASQVFHKDKLHKDFKAKAEAKVEKNKPCKLRHICMPAMMYGDPQITHKYVAIWLDYENNHVIEAIGTHYSEYVISRHYPIAGTSIAYSPIATTALIDARSLNLMTDTLLDAAERHVRPPIVATKNAIVGKLDMSGRSATWIEQLYDERMGEPLRTLDMGSGGYPVGQDMHDRMENQLGEDLYEEKLTLPERTETASEWNDRMQAYRLGVIPILQPVLDEDSAKTCDLTFDILAENNFFGSPEDIPEEIQGSDIEFEFRSPLTQTENEKVASTFLSSLEIVANAMGLDPTAGENFNVHAGLRDALEANSAKQHWITEKREVEKKLAQHQVQQEVMQAAEMMQGMANEASA